MDKLAYLVTQYYLDWKETDRADKGPYTIQGIFDSEEKAIEACRDESYGYGALGLNDNLPHEECEWPFGFHYPWQEGAKK